MLDGDCTIFVNGVGLRGGQSVQVHRSCETIPNTFSITGADADWSVATTLPEGAPCQILFGDDPVLTGFVDTVATSVTPRSHSVTLTGRGKTSDLVDCTCIPQVVQGVESLAFAGLDLEAIVGELCAPYGVDYSVRADLTPAVPQAAPKGQLPYFSAEFVDTPAAVIAELARFYGVLVYEDVDGSLVFERAAQTPAASGFAYAQNVESFHFSRSMAERFSEVRVYTSATAESLNTVLDNVTLLATRTDPNVTRFRRHAQVCASPVLGFGEQEAAWEVARRYGRSRPLSLTVPGWRDVAGALWAPNTTASVQLPGVPTSTTWVISEVTFLRDEGGTRTDVSLLPAEAFSVEPIFLVKDGADYLPVLAQQNAAADS